MQENEREELLEEELPAEEKLITEEDTSFSAVDEVREDVDYAALAVSDLAEIKSLCREFAAVEQLSDLPFARRFAELRDLGLSVKEALGASLPLRESGGGKAHLKSAVPRPAYLPENSLSHEDMRKAKELFYGLSEKEINALYRRVTH